MLKISSLSYQVNGRVILQDINFALQTNTITSVIGPNGSGKTTLIKHIVRTIKPKKACIHLMNRDINSNSPREFAKQVAYVPQENYRDTDFSVYDVVMMGRYAYQKGRVESQEDIHIVCKAMQTMKVFHLKDQKISSLSGGEAQRVFIARALSQKPKLLILDEPTSMLDIHHGIELMNILKRYIAEENITILMILHDLNLAFRYSDYIFLMNEGKSVLYDTTEKVMENSILKKIYHSKIDIVTCNNAHYIIPKVV